MYFKANQEKKQLPCIQVFPQGLIEQTKNIDEEEDVMELCLE
jgi:hypothetical protein